MAQNFLLHVPLCVDPLMRTRWNGIGFAIQALKIHYSALIQYAPTIVEAEEIFSSNGGRPEDWPELYHIAMFACAWGMIDQIYAIASIARGLTLKPDTPFSRFIESSHEACLARNHMDHLHQRIDNFVRRERKSPPLFGSLSFHHIKSEDLGDENILRGATIITIMSMMNEKVSLQAVAHNRGYSYQVEHPNGCFELQIEDVKVALSEAYRAALDVEEYFNTEVRSRIEVKAREAALAAGVDPETVLAQTTSLGIAMRVDVAFGGQPAETVGISSV